MEAAFFEKWVKDAAKRNAAAIIDSRAFFSIFSEDFEKDALAILQFGLAVAMDKPLFFIAPHGRKIPKNVIMLARKIAYYDPDKPEDFKRATEEVMAEVAKLRDQELQGQPHEPGPPNPSPKDPSP